MRTNGDSVDIFTHISEFQERKPPVVGDLVTYDISDSPKGKKATNVSFVSKVTSASSTDEKKTSGFFGVLLMVLSIAILAGAAMITFNKRVSSMPETSQAEPLTKQTSRFQCSGKTHCSEMTSCEEAVFYLRNCPGTEVDGDGDGIPCESQWCGG